MTPQFKKFLLIITSIVIGWTSLVLLVNTAASLITGENFNAGPALGILFVPVSIIIMFVSYKLLKKVLH